MPVLVVLNVARRRLCAEFLVRGRPRLLINVTTDAVRSDEPKPNSPAAAIPWGFSSKAVLGTDESERVVFSAVVAYQDVAATIVNAPTPASASHRRRERDEDAMAPIPAPSVVPSSAAPISAMIIAGSGFVPSPENTSRFFILLFAYPMRAPPTMPVTRPAPASPSPSFRRLRRSSGHFEASWICTVIGPSSVMGCFCGMKPRARAS